MNFFKGVSFSRWILNAEDELILSSLALSSNRVLERDTGFFINLCELENFDIADHLNQELDIIFGKELKDRLSDNIIQAIKYALIHDCNMITFDDDAAIPDDEYTVMNAHGHFTLTFKLEEV